MLGPSLSIGRLFGIPLRVHWSFSLLVAWVAVINLLVGGSLQSALGGVVFMVLLFICVTLHELGHCLAARRYGISTRHITLSPIGGLAALDAMPRRWTQELWIALAGPAVNVVICALLLPVLLFHPISLTDLIHPFSSVGSFATKLFVANFLLAAFNLLPAFPMDGGRVFRALLSSSGDHLRATRIAVRTGQGFAVVFGILGILYSPFLLLIAAFLFFAAEAEYRGTRANLALEGWTVGDVMTTRVQPVPADLAIADAAALALRTGQDAFPVIDQGHIVGVLERGALVHAAMAGRHADRAIDHAIRDFAVAATGDDVRSAIELMSKCGQRALPVFDGQQLVGMIHLTVAGTSRSFPSAAGPSCRNFPRVAPVPPPCRDRSDHGAPKGSGCPARFAKPLTTRATLVSSAAQPCTTHPPWNPWSPVPAATST